MRGYCINLASRPERWEKALADFNKQGLMIERFDALKGIPGWEGCRDSHLAVLKLLRDKQFHSDWHFPFVFEDDCEFFEGWKDSFWKARNELPMDWSILYLGCNPQSPLDRYSEHLFIAKHCLCLHAVLYNNRKNGVIDYILACRNEIRKIDDFYVSDIQESFKCFAMYPLGITQYQSQSDNCRRSDLSTIVKNFNKYTENAVKH